MRAGIARGNNRIANHFRWLTHTPSQLHENRARMASLSNTHGTTTSTPTKEFTAGQEPTEERDKTQITPNWRNMIDISIARSRKIRGGNYVQLATCTPEGHPRVRTIVQRGIMQHRDHRTVLKFITDRRSEKVSQLKVTPEAELCWWFLKSSEQYRIRGKLTVVGSAEDNLEASPELMSARKQQWGNLRDSAREQFYWTQPGVPINEETDEKILAPGTNSSVLEVPVGGRGSDGKVLPPPKTFLLLLLWPEYVDYLRLTDNCRMIFQRMPGVGDVWNGHEVSP